MMAAITACICPNTHGSNKITRQKAIGATAVYVAGVFIVLLLEKTIEAYGETGGIGLSLQHVFENKDLSHAAGVTLMCASLFLFYNVQEQVSRWIGDKNLRAAFFAVPSASEQRDTTIVAGPI